MFRKSWPLLLGNLWPTADRGAAPASLIGNLGGDPARGPLRPQPLLQAAYFPVVLFFNTIPMLALSPIIILIFGLGMMPKIIIAAIICFFPTLVNMVRGLNSADAERAGADARAVGDAARRVFWRLRLPRAMPMLFTSLRIASATAVIGAIVGEWIGSDKGLGALIIQATFNYQSDRLYAAIVLSSSLSILLFLVVVLIERRMIQVLVALSRNSITPRADGRQGSRR